MRGPAGRPDDPAVPRPRSPVLILGASVAAAVVAPLALALYPGGPGARTRWVDVRFTGPGGFADSVLVGLPTWYGPEDDPPLPLVISPHSRGLTPWRAARRWGDLPGRDGVVVLEPGLHGRVIPRRSWAWPPDVAELARLPRIVSSRLPYLRYDRRRVYAAGFSMGGQEALMMLARRPDLFAGVVAADPVTDLARRWGQFRSSLLSRGEQQAVTREVGATPSRAPWLYVRRSPLAFARTIAFSRVPLELWWNPRDPVVVDQRTQAGALYRAIRRLAPGAPVVARIHHEPHGWVFDWAHRLPAMLGFLLAHRRPARPPEGFAYASWRPSAAAWGWRFRATGVGHGLWGVSGVGLRGLETDTPGPLRIRPPRPLAGRLTDGARLPESGGWLSVAGGRHVIRLLPPVAHAGRSGL
jgi:hypothetical protein